jgi:hypothetical protein
MSSQVLAMPQRMPRRNQQRRDSAAIWAAAAVAVIAAIGLWIWGATAERRAIEALGPEERRGLFVRTKENLRSACAATSEPLVAYCQQQASFLLEFPECDEACKALARGQIAHTQPTR